MTQKERVAVLVEQRFYFNVMLTCANVHHPAQTEKDHVILISDQIGPGLRCLGGIRRSELLSSTGQTVCLGDPQRPCYKIAYFQDVWSRVAFKEASEACEMDGGSLLSIQTAGEQADVENLLQVRLSLLLLQPSFL